VGVLGLWGCKVGPDYVRPPPAEPPPASFKEAGNWKVAQPQDALRRDAWWKLFGQPELDPLIAQLDASNQSLKSAEAQYRQSRAAVGVARAGAFPTVTANLGATRAHHLGPSSSVASAAAASRGDSTTYSLPVDLTWELDLWGRVARLVEASEGGAQASAADLESARLSAQAALVQDVLLVQALDTGVQLLRAAERDYEKTVEVTRNRYEQGVAARSDLLQVQSQLEVTRAQAIDLGVQRAQVEHAVAVLLGKNASSFSLPPRTLTAEPPLVPAVLPSELLERRPDVAAAERRMAAANAQIGVAHAAWFPRITIGASGGFLSSSLGSWLTWPSLFWSVGPALAQTLFEGGLRSAQEEQVRAGYDATVASYRQTALVAFQEVEDNLATLRILEEEAQVQDRALQAARQATEIVSNQYRAGTVGYLDVLVSETSTLSAERVALDIRSRRWAATVLLVKAIGGGWSRPEP
jgi:NodT family efflux transporter outer membrane factor (OMF) lipoprotein